MDGLIRVGIVGYGNLGRGVELALAQNSDMALAGIYTRRPDAVSPQGATTAVHAVEVLDSTTAPVDVLILCGGSADDLPRQGPHYARRYNTVDSYDNHAHIPEYFEAVDGAARAGGTLALISAGWDPGLFSLNRLYGEAVLPRGATYTFWGKGVSQGHSEAVRRLPGVVDAVQYTIPVESALADVRAGELPQLTTRDKHRRECFVVLEDGADADTVRQAIITMPDYFAPYDTTVHFISAEELKTRHTGMPHGGFVLRSGVSGHGAKQIVEYALKLESNPEFTASVLVACARAVHRLHQAGETGARTMLDVPPALLSPKSPAELRRELL